MFLRPADDQQQLQDADAHALAYEYIANQHSHPATWFHHRGDSALLVWLVAGEEAGGASIGARNGETFVGQARVPIITQPVIVAGKTPRKADQQARRKTGNHRRSFANHERFAISPLARRE